ncbi:MAG: carboxypeptidase-like regulatory domain-containing protein [Gemmatimonadaceae bacterium]
MRRGYHRAALGAIAVLAFSSTFAAEAAAQAIQDSTGSVVVVVTGRDGGATLGYSVVSIAAYAREVFTNDQGVAVLAGLPTGHATVRVRHLGYSPNEVAVLVRGGKVDTARVAMVRIAVSLNTVRVRAIGACTTPGPPRAAADPAFAAVFEQLRLNADQYRLLATEYPFAYSVERESSIHYVGGDSILQRLDTINIGTGVNWHYGPGNVISQSDDPRNRQVVFNLPALIHFAEPGFLANHCFANGGIDTTGGRKLIRIDFAASAKIKAPDVDGSMYLDPVSYQIRQSVLRLTKIPEQTPQIVAAEVLTEFREVLPSIALMSVIRSTNTLSADPTRPILPDAVHETQRLLRVMFLKGKPGDPTSRP